jgi:hypothetical protein
MTFSGSIDGYTAAMTGMNTRWLIGAAFVVAVVAAIVLLVVYGSSGGGY